MLLKFSNLNKYGNLRHRIIYVDKLPFTYNPEGLGKFVGTSRFRYMHEHYHPPGLFVDLEGNKYITPTWIKVHPKTTLEDINWVKPSLDKVEKSKIKTWEFKSSSSDQVYTVTYNENKIKCDCMGFFRSRGNCKHVKQVKKELNDK